MRRAAKKDNNHNAIADAFMRMGCVWVDTHRLGDNFPDGIASICGFINLLVEIKQPEKKLEEGQARFRDNWPGAIAKVSTIEEVVYIVNAMRRARTIRELQSICDCIAGRSYRVNI